MKTRGTRDCPVASFQLIENRGCNLKTATIAVALGALAMLAAPQTRAQEMSPYGMWGEDARDAPRGPPPSYDEDDYGAPPSAYRYERRRYGGWGDRRYRDADFYGGYYDDGFGGFDAPPPQGYGQYDSDDNGPGLDGEVVDGGARPDVRPVAPPVVAFSGAHPVGSIVIDVGSRKLYFVNSNATAYAYPIGVGRQGFSWTGTEKISRIAEWPDWHPPKEMRERKPELPAKMTGGLNNPLGARAIYLGATLYRIHGTNDPKSIGRAESSGCFRMMNGHVAHLAQLAQVGADVTVVKSLGPSIATSGAKAVR
ncbi:MAG: L,D-transpeptidase [Hyphomicrobium sp.]